VSDDQPGRPDESVAGLPADQALAVLYGIHYRPLTQLAALLASGGPAAEQIVQDAFVALHRTWPRLGDDDRAVTYLLRTVVRRARATARSGAPPDQDATLRPDSRLLGALRALPARQREVLVLSYFADLPEARIADVTGIRAQAVRSYLDSGLSALAAADAG
jgi:DNA-directed RNA polymerase specialized sigma24 family protein